MINLLLFIFTCSLLFISTDIIRAKKIEYHLNVKDTNFHIITNKYSNHKYLVAKEDFEQTMSWQEAYKACKKLGEGWRLPRIDELKGMYFSLYQENLGNFKRYFYWSSEGSRSYPNSAMGFSFGDGYDGSADDSSPGAVRAVRDYPDKIEPPVINVTAEELCYAFHKCCKDAEESESKFNDKILKVTGKYVRSGEDIKKNRYYVQLEGGDYFGGKLNCYMSVDEFYKKNWRAIQKGTSLSITGKCRSGWLLAQLIECVFE